MALQCLEPPLPASEVYRRVSGSVVAIDVPDGSGGGVLLSRAGLVATNHHLVEGWSTVLVRLTNGHRGPGRVVRAYRDPDLAFVQLEPPLLQEAIGLASQPLIGERAPEGRMPQVGETVYAIGHPLGLEYSLSSGVVSGIERSIEGRRYIQLDAAINPGNSGGPICDDRARLVGLITCSRAESQGLNFAIPAPLLYRRFNDYLQERAQGGVHYCPSCGMASRSADYCHNCGALIALADAFEELGATAGSPEAPGAAADPEPPAAERCPVCGVPNPEHLPYCPVCGATL
ncbi:S1C family serine protease [Vulcanococcus limneticus]|uniref:S1C family serine protease n=1 Tax=Vulcanococcus limneticus TaxID=2170428 RepID=UPI00398BBE4E